MAKSQRVISKRNTTSSDMIDQITKRKQISNTKRESSLGKNIREIQGNKIQKSSTAETTITAKNERYDTTELGEDVRVGCLSEYLSRWIFFWVRDCQSIMSEVPIHLSQKLQNPSKNSKICGHTVASPIFYWLINWLVLISFTLNEKVDVDGTKSHQVFSLYWTTPLFDFLYLKSTCVITEFMMWYVWSCANVLWNATFQKNGCHRKKFQPVIKDHSANWFGFPVIWEK